MPSRSLHFCSYPGCRNLTTDKYCTEHADCEREKAKQYDDRRGTSRSRGYDSTWEKARAAYLSKHPLCEMCERKGKLRPAVLVHHIKPISFGGDRLNESNFMALCRDCHEIVHGRKRG